MAKLSEFAKDLGSTLPGFGLLAALVSAAYVRVRGTDRTEITLAELAGILTACWLADRIGSKTVDRFYDFLYGPGRAERYYRWGLDQLNRARDAAAHALFVQHDVHTYRDAERLGFVAARGQKGPSLYRYSTALALRTETWEKGIAKRLEYSKAARALFVIALVAAGALLSTRLSAGAAAALTRYAVLLGPAGTDWAMLAIALIALCISLVLRWQHHRALYLFVAATAYHLTVVGAEGKATDGVILVDTRIPQIVRDALTKAPAVDTAAANQKQRGQKHCASRA